MLQRPHILALLLAIACVGLLAYLVVPGEPRYKGKTVSQWLELADKQPGEQTRSNAAAAVKALGPKAIRPLLKLIAYERAEEEDDTEILADDPPRSLARHMRIRAVEGFAVLGATAKPAIPQLAKLLSNTNVGPQVVFALAAIGPEAYPALIQAATNKSFDSATRFMALACSTNRLAIPALLETLKEAKPPFRREAALALGVIGQQPEIVVPALIERLSDTNIYVRTAAAVALGRFGPQAKSAGPEIRKMLDDPAHFVRKAARNGLAAIEPKPVRPRIYLNVEMPDRLTEADFQKRLTKAGLTADEIKLVENPLIASPEMKAWALDLTRGATNDEEKAELLFRELTGRPAAFGTTARTAKEVFAEWDKPGGMLDCRDYAILYVALARAIDLKSCFVFVERDVQSNGVVHACAAVDVGAKVLLVDPTVDWFGVPYREAELWGDTATTAYCLSLMDFERCKLAAKLRPDMALVQYNLFVERVLKGQWDEAATVLTNLLKFEPDTWLAKAAQAEMARHEKRYDEAIKLLKQAVEIKPYVGRLHFNLGCVYASAGKLAEARSALRICLQRGPLAEDKIKAEQAIKEITDFLGPE